MMTKVRRIVQLIFLMVFIFLFLQARYPYEVYSDSDIFLRSSPLLPLFDFIQTFSVSLIFWPALLILLITPFMGRIFCGWICPLGTTLDISDKIIKAPSNKKAEKWQKFTKIKFGLLIAFNHPGFFFSKCLGLF